MSSPNKRCVFDEPFGDHTDKQQPNDFIRIVLTIISFFSFHTIGHQKRIMLAIKKLQSLAKGSSSSNTNGGNSNHLNHYSSASSLQSSTNLNSSLNSLNSSHSTTSKSSSLLHANLYLPLQTQPIYGVHAGHQTYQEVAINTNRNSTKLNGTSPDGVSNNTSVNSSLSLGGLIGNSNGTPTTPELKTFQQLSTGSTTSSTVTSTTVHPSHHQLISEHLNGSIGSSSNSLASSLNNSSNSASVNLPPLLVTSNGHHLVNGTVNGQPTYAYLNGNLNGNHATLINGAQIGQMGAQINGQIVNGQHHLINGNRIASSTQLNQMPPQVVMVSRGRSMESLPHHPEPIYGVSRQMLNGQTAIATVDGQQMPVQVIYANANQLQATDANGQTIYLQPQTTNEMYLILNNDMDGTATLNRPKNLTKNRPVAKIAAKTRELNGMTDQNGQLDDNISEQKQALLANQQIYGNLQSLNGANYPNGMSNTVIVNNMINANLNNGQLAFVPDQQIYESSAFLQQKLANGMANGMANGALQDRNSYIYATLKRSKKVPPPIPKRTNSMRTGPNGQPQQLSAPSTPSSHQPSLRRGNSLDDAQNLLTHQLNQLALAQKLKQQLNQRSSCSNLETMQEEVFASCVKSLTSRFSMDSSSLDDLPTPTVGSTTSAPNQPATKNNSSPVSNGTASAANTVGNTAVNTVVNGTVNGKPAEQRRADEPPIQPPTDSKANQLANSLSAAARAAGHQDKEPTSASLNQSNSSGDFPPLPSPSMLLNNSANDSSSSTGDLPHPKPTITPPLPSPPVVSSQQTPNGSLPVGAQQANGNVNGNANINVSNINNVNLNNINRTLAAQFTRPFKPAGQVFKFDHETTAGYPTKPPHPSAHPSPHHLAEQCSVSSSSSTESMLPFANDNVGTMRPRPNQLNGASAQHLKQFASSSSSSSICSVSSMTSSSTSSSLSSASSNANGVPTSCSSSSLTQPILNPPTQPPPPLIQTVPSLQTTIQSLQANQTALQNVLNHQNHQSVLMPHQSPYQSLAPTQPQHYNNLNNSTGSNGSSHAGNTIENVVRTSVNCISNLSNHLNLSKLIASNPASTFRLLGKPVQPPQVPVKPATSITATKNWPCSPVKQVITSPEHVPNISQIGAAPNGTASGGTSFSTSTLPDHVADRSADRSADRIIERIDRPVTTVVTGQGNGLPVRGASNEANKTMVNHGNFRSQPTGNPQSSSRLNE